MKMFRKFKDYRKILKENAKLLDQHIERNKKQSCADQMQQVIVIDDVAKELLKEREDLRARLSRINVKLHKFGIVGEYCSRKDEKE